MEEEFEGAWVDHYKDPEYRVEDKDLYNNSPSEDNVLGEREGRGEKRKRKGAGSEWGRGRGEVAGPGRGHGRPYKKKKNKGKGRGKNSEGPWSLAHNKAGKNSGDENLMDDSDDNEGTEDVLQCGRYAQR